MKPYYSHAGIAIYHGDVLDVLDSGAISKVDGIVWDPPYCSGGRQQSSSRLQFDKNSCREDAWFLADNMGTDTYLWWMRQIGVRLRELSTMGTHLYCFTDWRQYVNVVFGFESVGWTLRNCVVWDKMRGGAMGSFWRNDHEWVAVLSKGPARELPHHGFFNVLHATKPQGDEHPTVKPASIIQTLVEASNAETILDPSMGSGTTLYAAKQLGKRAIGIEIEERYCEIAANRLSQEVLALA